jgi:hypothetical protein
MKDLTLFSSPFLQLSCVSRDIFEDWEALYEERPRSHEHLKALKHFVDDDDLGSIRGGRRGLSIHDTQDDRGSVACVGCVK